MGKGSLNWYRTHLLPWQWVRPVPGTATSDCQPGTYVIKQAGYNQIVYRFSSQTDRTEEHEDLCKALALIKDMIAAVDLKVNEYEKNQKWLEILSKIENKTCTKLKSGHVFRKQALLSKERTLLHDGVVYWKTATGRFKGTRPSRTGFLLLPPAPRPPGRLLQSPGLRHMRVSPESLERSSCALQLQYEPIIQVFSPNLKPLDVFYVLCRLQCLSSQLLPMCGVRLADGVCWEQGGGLIFVP